MIGRPRKGLEKSKCYGFSMSGEYDSLVVAAKELALRENKSFGDIMQAAMTEYLKVHYPGNPQPPLFAQTQNPNLESEISLGYMRSQLKTDLKNWDKIQPSSRTSLAKKITAELFKAAHMQDRINDSELGDLIRKARQVIGI
jgi:hypothetical protein